MLIKLTSQNCAFFVKSRKILLIFLFFLPRLVLLHCSTTFPQQNNFRAPGDGAVPFPHEHSCSGAAGSLQWVLRP